MKHLNYLLFLAFLAFGRSAFAQITFIDSIQLPNVHGLSGIDFISGDWENGAKFVGITDKATGSSKLIEFTLTKKSGEKLIVNVNTSATLTYQINGESIRRINSKYFIASERSMETNIFTTDLRGSSPKSILSNWKKGRIDNAGFESLTFDGKYLYTIWERSARGKGEGYRYDPDSGKEESKFKYKIQELIKNGDSLTSITEMLFIAKNNFLFLEKEWNGMQGENSWTEVVIRLVKIEGDTATEVHSFDIDSLLGNELNDNYEGLCWGPDLDGKKTLILVSDDNGGEGDSANQKTWIVLLAVDDTFLTGQ